jgi:hypothetical protein
VWWYTPVILAGGACDQGWHALPIKTLLQKDEKRKREREGGRREARKEGREKESHLQIGLY